MADFTMERMTKVFAATYSDMHLILDSFVVDGKCIHYVVKAGDEKTFNFKFEDGRFFMRGKDCEWHEYTARNEEDFRVNLYMIHKAFIAPKW